MEPGWYIGKRFWQFRCGNQLVIDTLSRNASLSESKCLRRQPCTTTYIETCCIEWRFSVKPCLSQSRLLWSVEVKNKIERQFQHRVFCKETDNQEFFLPAEGAHPQNYIVDQQRLQLSNKFPALSTFSCWKLRFKTQVSASSGFPSGVMLWIKEVEMVDSVDVS